MSDLPPGHRVVITELGDTPLDATDRHAQLVEMATPDVAALGASDVVVAARSAAVVVFGVRPDL
ncbi:MAG: hypothetical protein H7138_02845 [Myxococcales bacterium]|nr:hypothetical protein [Myxococcales bacterium]